MQLIKKMTVCLLLIGMVEASAQSLSESEKALTETPISAIYDTQNKMPDAKRLAIYQWAAELYVQNVGEKYPNLHADYETFFSINQKDQGYEEYLRLVDMYNIQGPAKGIDPAKISAYELVKRIGFQHHLNLERAAAAQSQNKK